MAVDKVGYNTIINNEKKLEPLQTPPKGWGVRHSQVLLLFLCLLMGFAVRCQLNVLMVAMIDTSGKDNCSVITKHDVSFNGSDITNNNSYEGCIDIQNIRAWNVYRTYDWNKATQEKILFSFFVGYTSMQMPMGCLAQKYGAKIPLLIALGVNGILCIFTPWIPLIGGWISISVCRLVQGMTQAAFYPSIHTMLAKWIPLSERGRLTNYAYSGAQIGIIIAFQVSGLLADSPTFLWPSSFWLFGFLSLLAFGLFAYFGASSPHEHPKMTTEELMYIFGDGSVDVVPKKRKVPWKEILKSPSVWGILIVQSGSGAGALLVMVETPLYMKNVLDVDLKRNGLYSSLPYAAMYVMSVAFGYLADYASNRNIMKVVNIRRTGNTIGLVVSGLFLLGFSFTTNTPLAVCLLILSKATHSGVHVGFSVNQIDLAPNFAGSIMALGNMLSNLTGLLVPVIVSNIVTDVKDHYQWQIVFVIFVAIQFVANAIFFVFAKGDVQPWNFYGDEEYDSKETEMSLIKKSKDIMTETIIINENILNREKKHGKDRKETTLSRSKRRI